MARSGSYGATAFDPNDNDYNPFSALPAGPPPKKDPPVSTKEKAAVPARAFLEAPEAPKRWFGSIGAWFGIKPSTPSDKTIGLLPKEAQVKEKTPDRKGYTEINNPPLASQTLRKGSYGSYTG